MTPTPRLQSWAEDLQQVHGHRVDLTLTRNRRMMISLKAVGRKHTVLRMHEAFTEAPQEVLDHLREYLRTRRKIYWTPVAAYARSIPVQGPGIRRQPPSTEGRFFRLDKELQTLLERFPDLPADISITWGGRGNPRRKRRRSIRFGSWVEDTRQIRIHPLLDQEWVPEEFMQFLIYHELCHAAAPPFTDSTGRQRIHHAAFKALESRFPGREKMAALEKMIFERLMKENQ